MIRARIVLNPAGDCLRKLEASGHAGYRRSGNDIVCAAFTVLVRSAVRALGETPGLSCQSEAVERGSLSCSVLDGERNRERLAGVTSVLCRGLKDLASEYPNGIDLEFFYEEE